MILPIFMISTSENLAENLPSVQGSASHISSPKDFLAEQAYTLLSKTYGSKIAICNAIEIFLGKSFDIVWLCRKTVGGDITNSELKSLAMQFANQPGKVAALISLLLTPPVADAREVVQQAMQYKHGAYDEKGNKHPALRAIEHLEVSVEQANFITDDKVYDCISRHQDNYEATCLGRAAASATEAL